ncbi:uncharacterized protein LOC143299981 [Babylonia areolata]|uniref:uncharacterized protein LOC143299981 n=1 Tax=Babylonia areolata TaxID=304850 RepID=UPI003FCF84C7
MRLLLCGLTLFLVTLAGATFLDFLTELQQHHSFQRLPNEEKLLFGELVVAAENDELKDFIDRVGLVRVLKLMDHMSHSDAEKFAAYLAEHSNYTHHAPDHGDVINKRQDDDEDQHGNLYSYLSVLHSSYYHRLPAQEQETLQRLTYAAQHRHLTEYLSTVGYGPVFGLLEQLDDPHAFEVSRLIENVLAAESSAPSGPVKRQDLNNYHHGFYNYLQNLNSQYYEHLPEEERKVYHDLLDAVQNKNLTGYIDANGYGPVFGFLEHLDYFHAEQTYDYLSNALQAEAAAAGN